MTPRIVLEKLILAFFIAAAAVVALPPAVYYLAPDNFYFGPHKLLLYFAVVGAGVALLYFFLPGSEEPLAHGPSNLEYLLRGLAAVSFWGFLGVFWLISYGVTYWLVRLISLISWSLDGPWFRAAPVAFYVSFVFALIFAMGIAAAIAQNITNRLYSIKVSSRIASYNQALREQKKTWIYSALSISALLVMGAIIHFGKGSWSFWPYFLLQLIPYGSCAWLLGLGRRVRQDAEIVNAVGRLLSAMGYEVVFSPRSKDPEFASLVSGLDIIAAKDKHALVLQVKTQSSSMEPVDWTAGSSLRIKAKALELQEVREKLEIPSLNEKESIRPLMVLAGRQQDSTLAEFSKQESVPVIVVDMDLIEKILNTEDPDELRKLADTHFRDIAECGAIERAMPLENPPLTEGQWVY
jgi:hypothetical protein